MWTKTASASPILTASDGLFSTSECQIATSVEANIYLDGKGGLVKYLKDGMLPEDHNEAEQIKHK